MALNRFLRTGRSAIPELQRGRILHVVTGNEASDADSIVSAIVYAYVLNREQQQQQRRQAPAASPTDAPLFVPVMSIPRADFALRFETVALFQQLGIDVGALVFADELDLGAVHERGELRLTLADHNVLQCDRAHLAEAVVGMIDHHEDEGAYSWVVGVDRNIAFEASTSGGLGRATVASACTLVAERALALAAAEVTNDAPGAIASGSSGGGGSGGATAAMAGAAEVTVLDECVASALLTVVLLDSVNLDPAARKVTERDVAAVHALAPLCGRTVDSGMSSSAAASDTATGTTRLFEELQTEKFSRERWLSLNAAECLKMDYKQYSAGAVIAGLASVLVTVPEFLAKAPGGGNGGGNGDCNGDEEASRRAQRALRAFASARGLRLLGVMSLVYGTEDGLPRREVLLFSEEPPLLAAVRAHLLACEALEGAPLDCAAVPAGSSAGAGPLVALRLGNAGASRKMVAPLLTKFCATLV